MAEDKTANLVYPQLQDKELPEWVEHATGDLGRTAEGVTCMTALRKMFNDHEALQRLVYKRDWRGLSTKAEYSMEWHRGLDTNFQALIHELVEFRDWANWKPWRKTHGHPISDQTRMEMMCELVDILHFFMNLMLLLNMSMEDLVRIYYAKRKENADRQAGGY